jgi:hypothetical protein
LNQSKPPTDDRRRDPRVGDLSIHATVLARHNEGAGFTIDDISAGGALLIGPLTLSIGERVQILFEVDQRPLDVSAEVVRVERLDMMNDRVAVRFVDSEASRTTIAAVVDRLRER